jgi:hypothetical protein
LVELVAESLLKSSLRVRNCIRAEYNSILTFIEKLAGSPGLAPLFADTGCDINVQVRKSVETF